MVGGCQKSWGVAQHSHQLQVENGKNHVLAAGKKQCGRAGVGLRDASHGPSLLWIFGVRFEDSDCFLLAWKAFKQIKNCISYSMMLRRKSVSK